MFELDPHISDSSHRCQKCQFYFGEGIMFTKTIEYLMESIDLGSPGHSVRWLLWPYIKDHKTYHDIGLNAISKNGAVG